MQGRARAGFATFAGLPHTLTARGADVAIMGVPLDGGASHRTGARFGPEAIRRASAVLSRYHPVHAIDVFASLVTVDWGDVETIPGHLARALDEVEGEVLTVLGADATPLLLGGDHTLLAGDVSALAAAFGPVALVMLDAHTDTQVEHDDERGSRGAVVRRAVEEGAIQPQRSLIAGLRGPLASPGELDWPEAMGFELIPCEELQAIGPKKFGERVRARVGAAPAHLSVDLDVVDPAFAPAVGTPEIGGLTSGELAALLRGLAGIGFRGYDIAELMPPYDPPGQPTALLAANVAYEFLALAAVAAKR